MAGSGDRAVPSGVAAAVGAKAAMGRDGGSDVAPGSDVTPSSGGISGRSLTVVGDVDGSSEAMEGVGGDTMVTGGASGSGATLGGGGGRYFLDFAEPRDILDALGLGSGIAAMLRGARTPEDRASALLLGALLSGEGASVPETVVPEVEEPE